MSSADEGFIGWAKSNQGARLAFRGVMAAARLGGGAVPSMPSRLLDIANQRFPDIVSMGGLTILSNICGNPAVAIPAGTVDGLPVSMQVLARHHADPLLFDVALAVERANPWPLVAPVQP
jgi:Asp-tRNA(Asn)/Glu-tRNA(Gln) amidotransferase A subunit family amidase